MKYSRMSRSYKQLGRLKRRSAQGTSLIELGAVAALMPLVAVISVNIGILVFAAGLNDGACKDAARAAAQRSSAADAVAAAKAIVGRYAQNPSTLLFGKPTLVSTAFEVYPDSNGNPQIDSTHAPNVTITVQSVVKMPAPIIFYGAKLTDNITFTKSYNFPILNPSSPGDTPELVETDPNATDNSARKLDKLIEAQEKKIEDLSEKAALADAAAAETAEIAEASKQAAVAPDNAVIAAQNAYNASASDANAKALKDAEKAAKGPDSNRDTDAKEAAAAALQKQYADQRLAEADLKLAELEHELEIVYNSEADLKPITAAEPNPEVDAGMLGNPVSIE